MKTLMASIAIAAALALDAAEHERPPGCVCDAGIRPLLL